MKETCEKEINEKPMFWAFIAPTIVFIFTMLIAHRYALTAALSVWLMATIMYIVTYKDKKDNAKDFAKYSIGVIMIFVFIIMIGIIQSLYGEYYV